MSLTLSSQTLALIEDAAATLLSPPRDELRTAQHHSSPEYRGMRVRRGTRFGLCGRASRSEKKRAFAARESYGRTPTFA
jgi:hypothetical protein